VILPDFAAVIRQLVSSERFGSDGSAMARNPSDKTDKCAYVAFSQESVIWGFCRGAVFPLSISYPAS
jgi:hypothetical protein